MTPPTATVIPFPPRPRTFLVRILYREPTYELEVGRKKAPYSWTYRVEAPSEEKAVSDAKDQFWMMARQSSVGWIREICETQVTPAPPSSPGSSH